MSRCGGEKPPGRNSRSDRPATQLDEVWFCKVGDTGGGGGGGGGDNETRGVKNCAAEIPAPDNFFADGGLVRRRPPTE
jgi:hypothetical protein